MMALIFFLLLLTIICIGFSKRRLTLYLFTLTFLVALYWFFYHLYTGIGLSL